MIGGIGCATISCVPPKEAFTLNVNRITKLMQVSQKSDPLPATTPPQLTQTSSFIDVDFFEILPLLVLLLIGLAILGYMLYTSFHNRQIQKGQATTPSQSKLSSIQSSRDVRIGKELEESFEMELEKAWQHASPELMSSSLAAASTTPTDKTSPISRNVQETTATALSGDKSSRLTDSSRDPVFSTKQRVETRMMNRLEGETPDVVRDITDPIALNRVLDFHNIFGFLLIQSNGTIVYHVLKPGEEYLSSIEPLARSFAFNPLELLDGGLYEVKARLISTFTALHVTGKYLRMILLLKKPTHGDWLVDAMIEALKLLEDEIEGKIDPEFVFPSGLHFKINVPPSELVRTLESWLPVSFLHQLIIRKDQIDEVEREQALPPRLIFHWKQVVYHLFMIFSGVDSTLLSFTYEELPQGLVVPTTFSQLWHVLIKDLRVPLTEAAETMVMGLIHDIIMAHFPSQDELYRHLKNN